MFPGLKMAPVPNVLGASGLACDSAIRCLLMFGAHAAEELVQKYGAWDGEVV